MGVGFSLPLVQMGQVVGGMMGADRKDKENRDRWGLFRSCRWSRLEVEWVVNHQTEGANRRHLVRLVAEGSSIFR